MTISASLLPEFDQEAAGTRKMLERVPDDQFAWRPHEKSMSLGGLGTHLARLPFWGLATLTRDSFDVTSPEAEAMQANPPASRQALLEQFDRGVTELRAALTATDDAQFLAPWSLRGNGQTYFSLPRIVVFRSMVLNHNVHHRAQLGVYLRLLDVPVPSLYGPTADEAVPTL